MIIPGVNFGITGKWIPCSGLAGDGVVGDSDSVWDCWGKVAQMAQEKAAGMRLGEISREMITEDSVKSPLAAAPNPIR